LKSLQNPNVSVICTSQVTVSVMLLLDCMKLNYIALGWHPEACCMLSSG